MEKILQTMRYLSTGFILMLAIGFGSLLGNVLFTNLIFHVTDRNNLGRAAGPLTVPLEMTASVFALLIGLLLFLSNFKVVIASGISRRTFLIANLPVALLAAAALALFNGVVVWVHELFWPAVSISHLLYQQASSPALLLLQFGLYFLLITAGWVISLAYYRASVPVRWVISLSPFVLFALLRVINFETGGAVETFIRYSLGLVGSQRNPYQGAAFLFVYAVMLFGATYLLIRRAPLKG
jgi:hypothetical protein